jgi:DNA-directed RNA polymerase subunit RPC12/RpoP
MAKIRCSACGTEIEVTQANKSKACGCSNQTFLRLDRNGMPIITGNDLSFVTAIEGISKPKEKKLDTTPTSGYTKRVPRKLDFEIR